MPWCVGCTFRWHCRVPLPSLNPNNIKCMTMASWVLRTLRLVKTTMNAEEGWVEVSSSSEIQTSTRRYCGLNFKDIIKLVTVFETVTTNSVHTGHGRCCRSVLYLAHLPASSYYSHPRKNQLPDHAVTFVLYPILKVEFGITGVINHFLQWPQGL